MPVTESTLRDIQGRINQAKAQQTRAQIEHENAKAKHESARAKLREEFGVSTNADAKAMLAKLEDDLEAVVTSVEAALAEAGA